MQVKNGQANIYNGLNVSGSTSLKSSGSTVLSIDGTSGRLFSVDDSLSGSLFSVNTAAGLPVMEAFSDNTVRVGQYGTLALFVSKSRVGIGKESGLNANLDILGTAIVSGSAVGSPAFYVTNGGVQFGSTTGFVWDASTNRLGIGTNAPSYILDVNGAARIVSSLVVNTAVIWGTGTRISVDGSVGCQDLYLGYNSSLGYIYNNNGAGYNITIGRNSAGLLNYIGIAATPSTAARIQLGGTHTAVSGVSRGTFINHALTAAANNDILVGLDVGSTFTNGAFTGVTNYAMRVLGSTVLSGSLTVSGSITATTPTPSSYLVQGILSADFPVSSSSDTVIPFVDQYDPNNWYDPATYRCTPTVAGYYNLSIAGWFTDLLTTGSQCNIQARKNNATIIIVQSPSNSSTGQSLTGTKLVYMNGTTDYLDFTIYQSTATSKNLIKGTSEGSGTWFSLHLLTM